ncbi:MAG: transglycosylase domain-containing protein [Verrucomicrobiales bacterium]
MSDDPGERRRAERRAKEERRRSKPPRKKGGGWFWKLFKFCCWAFLIALIVVPTGLYFYLKPFYEKAKVFNLSEIGKLEEPSTIYDRTGQEYGRIYVQDRRPVTIDEIPHHLIEALVAAEDSRFFAHSGVDYMGMTRAALRNLRAGGTKQGASTITQQLARQTFQILDRTMARKFTEIFLARRIEDPQDGGLPKQKILEHYLNLIYFGSGYYGVGAAAQGYFGKPVNELTIDEAALLCGLIKQPHVLSPFNNLERSIQERNYVLSRMVTEGMLSEDEAKKYKGVVPKLAEKQGDARMSFAYEEVRQRVIDQLGFEEAASGGFKIYTTLDGPLQKSLEESLLKRLAETERHPGFEHQTYAQYCAALARLPEDRSADPEAEALAPNYLQGAGLAIENETGAVLAVVCVKAGLRPQQVQPRLQLAPRARHRVFALCLCGGV